MEISRAQGGGGGTIFRYGDAHAAPVRLGLRGAAQGFATTGAVLCVVAWTIMALTPDDRIHHSTRRTLAGEAWRERESTPLNTVVVLYSHFPLLGLFLGILRPPPPHPHFTDLLGAAALLYAVIKTAVILFILSASFHEGVFVRKWTGVLLVCFVSSCLFQGGSLAFSPTQPPPSPTPPHHPLPRRFVP